MNIILIDLKNTKEVEKFLSLNPNNNKMLDNYLKEGRTEIGYDESTGDILLAVQNGKLIYVEGKLNVNFKRIVQ